MTFALVIVVGVACYLAGTMSGWKQAVRNVQAAVDEGALR